MDHTLQSLFALMRVTATDPIEGARRVKAWDLPKSAVWQGFALVVVLSVLLTEVAAIAAPQDAALYELLRQSPFFSGLLQAFFLLVMVHATHRIGAAFGGAGTFEESLRLVVWLQLMLIGMQIVQLVALIVLPPLAPLIVLAAMVWFFWLLTSFVMVLHGFASRGKVFMGIVLAFIAIVFAISLTLTMLGVVIMPADMQG